MSKSQSWYVRAGSGAAILVFGLGLIAIYGDVLASPSQERFVVTLLTNVVIVVGVQIYVGNSGIVSFGHIAFMGIGAYAAALISIPEAVKATALPNLPSTLAGAEFSLVPSVVVGIVAAGLAAAVIGLAITRLSGGAGSIASLAVLIIFYVVASNWTDVTGGVRAIYGVPRMEGVWFVFIVAALAVLVGRMYREAGAGIGLRASADDPIAASASGVDYLRLRYSAWILSGMVVGAGGAIFAHDLTSFGPSAFYLRETFLVLAMLIIGGMGSVSGAVCGAVVLSVVSEWLRGVEDGFSVVIFEVGPQSGVAAIALAVAMLALLTFRPQGIVGRHEANELMGVIVRLMRRIRDRIQRLDPRRAHG